MDERHHSDSISSRKLKDLALWLGLWLLVCRAVLATSSEHATRFFDIEQGAAPGLLNEFSRQADIQVLFDFEALKDRQTEAVHGRYSPAEALKIMLRGMGLGFDFVNERTISIFPEGESHSRSDRRPRSFSEG